MDTRVYMNHDSTLLETLEDAYCNLKVELFAPIERCRLVAYDQRTEQVIRSFEGMENQILGKIDINPLELLIEIREDNQEFEIVEIGSVLTKVFTVNITNGDVDGPTNIRGLLKGTVGQYKTVLSKKLPQKINVGNMMVALHKNNGIVSILDNDEHKLQLEEVNFLNIYLYVSQIKNFCFRYSIIVNYLFRSLIRKRKVQQQS